MTSKDRSSKSAPSAASLALSAGILRSLLPAPRRRSLTILLSAFAPSAAFLALSARILRLLRQLASPRLVRFIPARCRRLLAALCSLLLCSFLSANALETSAAATAIGIGEFALEPDTTEHAQERKEIENLLGVIETQWNAHNLESVMGNYAEDYVNNDGLDKKAVTELTKDFWKTYPDAKSTSKTKQIRIDGAYATIESRDMAIGTTDKEMPGIGTKGDLNSISEGQLYMKKTGNIWKIIGDRIDYEKVRVAFGLARQLQASFSAPEQVKSGKQFAARLELTLPAGLTAVGSITNQVLEYPQPAPSEVWRPLEGAVLERVINANANNHNELLMATIGITNVQRNTLMGIEFLTRRLNVIPGTDDRNQKPVVASDTKASNKSEQAKNDQ